MMVSLGAEVGLFRDFRISEDSTVLCLRVQIVLSLGLISFHFLQVFFFKCGYGFKDDKNRTNPLHLWAVTRHHPTPVFFRRIQNLGPFNTWGLSTCVLLLTKAVKSFQLSRFKCWHIPFKLVDRHTLTFSFVLLSTFKLGLQFSCIGGPAVLCHMHFVERLACCRSRPIQ
jgi:hypothetical protein